MSNNKVRQSTPPSIQPHVKPCIPLPRHNEQRHLKRLSRPVHGNAVDLKQNARIQKARISSCIGELRATRKKIAEHYARERVIPVLRKKHNLAPRRPKHNTLKCKP